jgi:hypothetical protein
MLTSMFPRSGWGDFGVGGVDRAEDGESPPLWEKPWNIFKCSRV